MAPYGQFCPVAKAAEVLCQRWSILVVRELLNGSTRFGDIQRGVPGCPPATLSKRLKELVACGAVRRVGGDGGTAYELTEAGIELYPIVEGFGRWGQRWVRSSYEVGELDVEGLLWDIRRFLDPQGLGVPNAVIQLETWLPEAPRRRFWVVVEPTAVDVCLIDPERPVDVVMDAELRALTRIWMGDIAFDDAVADGSIALRGDRSLTRRIPAWLGRHPVLGSIGPAERSAGP
jgi:DNA-binding HxlR family transcriptional regulator